MATILVVDDDPTARDLLTTVLNFGGHRLKEASDGTEGLAMAVETAPELIIADLLMPSMDGFEFVRRLRDHAMFAKTPVIFYTASYLEREARKLAQACGVNHIITKPAEPQEILSIVGAALGTEHEPVAPPEVEDFQREHVQLLTAKLSQRAEHAIPRFNALIELGLELATERSTERLLNMFCVAARKIVGAKYSAIAVLDPAARKVTFPAVSGMIQELAEKLKSPTTIYPVVKGAMTNSAPRRLDGLPGDPTVVGLPPDFPNVNAFLSTPIASPDRVYGWLCLVEKIGGPAFTEEDEGLACLLTAQVGRIYENGALFAEVRRHAEELEAELTVRERIDEALRESEERYRNLIEEARDAIFVLGLDRKIRSANRAFELISGWPRNEWLNREFPPLVHQDDQQAAVAIFQAVITGGKPPPFELRLKTKAGGFIPLEFTVTVERKGDEILGIMGIGRDVRERKQLEIQLRQAQKMESIGQLAGGVAHDFNNLLTVIQGHTDLVRVSEGLPQAITESIHEISLAAKRAAALTRQLLTFSRQQVLQPKNVDLNEVVAQISKMLGRLLGEHIDLRFDPSPVTPMVHADVGMMEQVLMNLAVNARDAMPKGGSLRIGLRIEIVEGAEASSHSEMPSGRYVCLTVTDTGCGISAEHMSKVFEPFFTTKELGKGTGLGLATVFGIVKQHHGFITVKSEVNIGTSFRIYLSPLPEGHASVESPTQNRPQKGGSEAVMVVEDEETLRRVVRSALERFGYRVFVAETAVEALRLWHELNQQIDLVLTDIVMPDGLTGHDLAKILRAEKPNLPIILSTGYTDRLVQKDLIDDPGLRFLRKPYDLSKLLHVIRECLDEHRNMSM